MWAGAQTTPTIIGTFTWNFNPPLRIQTQGFTCGYSVPSLPLIITHFGNNQYHLMTGPSAIAYAPNTGTAGAGCYDAQLNGNGIMNLSGTNYNLSMYLSVPFANNDGLAYANLSCILNSTTLSGQCSVPSIIGQYVFQYQATFAPK
jgi:hypothetical protein